MRWFRRAERGDNETRTQDAERLYRGAPIMPVRRAPLTLDSVELPSFVTESDKAFFAAFAPFSEVTNGRFAKQDSCWRIQELARFWLTVTDMPMVGRRYEVFFNQHRLGELQLSANLLLSPSFQLDEAPTATSIELSDCHALEYREVADFLTTISDLVSYPTEGILSAGRLAIRETMAAYLWDVTGPNGRDATLRLDLSGSARLYVRIARNEGLLP